MELRPPRHDNFASTAYPEVTSPTQATHIAPQEILSHSIGQDHFSSHAHLHHTPTTTTHLLLTPGPLTFPALQTTHTRADPVKPQAPEMGTASIPTNHEQSDNNPHRSMRMDTPRLLPTYMNIHMNTNTTSLPQQSSHHHEGVLRGSNRITTPRSEPRRT